MPSKIYPNRDFWFENLPSGNPAGKAALKKVISWKFAETLLDRLDY
jgi:hypothetical protein